MYRGSMSFLSHAWSTHFQISFPFYLRVVVNQLRLKKNTWRQVSLISVLAKSNWLCFVNVPLCADIELGLLRLVLLRLDERPVFKYVFKKQLNPNSSNILKLLLSYHVLNIRRFQLEVQAHSGRLVLVVQENFQLRDWYLTVNEAGF